MRRLLILLTCVCLPLTTLAGGGASGRLAGLLQEMVKREEVTPDSFFNDVLLLRQEIAAQQDSTARAVYRASLAHLLALNADRAQTHSRQTASHPDSIQEWSREEYVGHAAALYRQSMRDLELLHSARTSQWLPLVRQGRDEAVFGGGMLSVVWNAMRSDLSPNDRRKSGVAGYAAMIDFYRSAGLSEAALRMELDSLDESMAEPAARRTKLLRLRDEYASLAACALVYLRLSELSLSNGRMVRDDDDSRREQLRWVSEGLARYPSSPYRADLENRRDQLEHPLMTWSHQGTYYPETPVPLPVATRNMQSFECRIYRVPDTLRLSGDSRRDAALVRRSGRLVKTIRRTLKAPSAVDRQRDTLTWRTPSFGHYAFLVDGQTNVALEHKESPQVSDFRVSALDFFATVLPDDQLRICVVDARSGAPQHGVRVDFFRSLWNQGELQDDLVASRTTGESGQVEFLRPKNNGDLYVQLSRSDDHSGRKNLLRAGRFHIYDFTDDTVHQVRLFTDRSIYRPGQTIYVSALSYRQHRWDAQTEAKTFKLTVRDPNRQVIAEREVTSDEYGVLHDSLAIPASGLLGSYMIRLGQTTAWVRVEEYRRPTFQVELEDGPLPTDFGRRRDDATGIDTLNMRGRAVTYSGVPVANARVTGTVQWRRSRWFWGGMSEESLEELDTLWTDADGRFTLCLPVRPSTADLRRGMLATAWVDVLSPQGETQQGEHSMPLCTTPLRMTGTVPELQDKGKPMPWTLTLYDRTEQTVKGSIECALVDDEGQTRHRFTLQAGQAAVPDGIEGLPSGRYRLEAQATVNGDTASYTAPVTLFSMQDTRLAVDTALWVHAADTKFSPGRSARVQLGSSLPSAWMHLVMTSEGGLVLDSLVLLHDSVFVLDIPYREAYRQGANLSVAVYSEGRLHSESVYLKLEQPDTQLRLHWNTFRNLLRPGEQEEWALHVARPDGSPAPANVMLSLYDAALDALAPHHIDFSVARNYLIPRGGWTSSYVFDDSREHSLPMSVKMRRTRGFVPSSWESRYFPAFDFAREEMVLYSAATGTRGGPRLAKNTTVQKEYAASAQKFEASEVNGLAFESVDQALQGQIAGLDVEEEDTDDDAGEEQAMDASQLRQNLSELAFFMPRLRTDADGVATIAFTLPESMTSWHLTGFAHTQDLMTAGIDETIVAQKELMAELHLPRFLRDGDEASLTASIRNISDEARSGQATWQILDAETERVLKSASVDFSLAQHADTTYTLLYTASADHPLLTVRWRAEGGECSDGEQRPLPVLSAMQAITETRAFSIKGTQQWQIDLRKLFSFDNPGAVNRRLTVEYTARPLWLALQSLPSLMEPTHKDVLSLATTFYAGSLAAHIARSVTGMQQALGQWKAEGLEESPLARNQELADMLLRETPWVIEAQREKAWRQRLVTLFESEAQTDRRMTILSAMRALQRADGSFAWYPGMRGSSYLTCSVAYMLTRLGVMTAGDEPDAASRTAADMNARAIGFLQKDVARETAEARKQKSPTVSLLGMQYLYLTLRSGQRLSGDAERDVRFMLDLLRRQSDDLQGEQRALAAIILQLSGEEKQARSLMDRFHTLLNHPDGTYLAYPSGSFTSIDRKIQRHVQVMEAVALVEPEDTATLQAMQEWLLQQKRTQEWEQPVQTADAVYALMNGDPLPTSTRGGLGSNESDRLMLQDGRSTVTLESPETSLGYLRERVEGVKSPRTLVVDKKSGGLSWGAVYAQYEMPASEVEAQREGLRIERTVESGKEATALQTGDRIHVRYVVTADRDYEYVRLMAPRPASAEPDTQISGYRWQGGIGYYRAIHDSGCEYFVDRLPRGTYVIEEDWLLSHGGTFQLAPATLQCLYAPEYQAHTAGGTIRVE